MGALWACPVRTQIFQERLLIMKRTAYLIGCILCGALILILVLSMTLAPYLQSRAEEKIVGVWFYDAFNGNGGQYVTFFEDGTVNLYEEVTAADGTTVYQDSASFGTMTYEILSSSEIRFTTTVMGSATTETAEYRFKGNNTLVLDDTTYTRYTSENEK